MAFSDLPPEVLDCIAHDLALHGKIARYAVISAAFQDVAEKRTLKQLKLTSLDLDKLGQIIDNGSDQRRLAAIQQITLDVVLPAYTDKACSWFERNADRDANNEAFTAAVTHLFRLLSPRHNISRAQPMSLSLGNVYSPMDISRRGRAKLQADQLAVATLQRKDLFEHRYEYSYIELLRPEALPVVHCIDTVNIATDYYRRLAPVTAVHISSKLPSLQTIEWKLLDTERKHRETRINLRQDFAHALESMHVQHGASLKLDFLHEPPSDEIRTSFDVRKGSDGMSDSFSMLLGSFLRTSHLVRIELEKPICIGPENFDLTGPSKSQGAVTWPCLQTFLGTFSTVRPDGGWYFERSDTDRHFTDGSDEVEEAEYVRMAGWNGIENLDADTDNSSSGYDSDESFFEETERPPDTYDEPRERWRQGMSPVRCFRSVPSAALDPLLKAAAKATPHMPALRSFSMGAEIQRSRRTGGDPQVFEFVFSAVGVEDWTDQDVSDRGYKRLTWTGPKEWRPSQDLADA